MLGDYQRLGVVAQGGRSTLWKGFDPALKREVALKQLTAADAAVAARREASVLAGLQHPNIVSVYDVLDDNGVWLIEQWISGASLSAVVAQTGKLRAIDALALIHGALSGLAYAHGRDVVHGDIAPGNILIDGAGTPMLVDFGLAVAPGQTSLGGTPGYMAPEAAAGQTVDKRSDVYSTCVVLAELLKGARLFPDSSLATAHQQGSGTADLGGIEAPVAVVLSTGLDNAPDHRPADAATLLAQLDEAAEKTHGKDWLALAGLGAIGSTAATIAAGTTLTGTTSAASTSATATSKSTTSMLSRGKLIGAAAAAGAAIVVVLIALILLRPQPHQRAVALTTPNLPAGTPAAAQGAQSTINGMYTWHYTSAECLGQDVLSLNPDTVKYVFQQGNTLFIDGARGPLNADGSFVVTAPGSAFTWRGVFATDGGRSVIRDGEGDFPKQGCHNTFVATAR